MSTRVSVLCLRSLTQEQIDQLYKVAHEITCIEPFEVVWMADVPEPQPEEISIFTSQRALRALQKSQNAGFGHFAGRKCLCVGTITAELAEMLGFTVLYAAHDAADLICYSETAFSEKKNFVHYCASDRLDLLSKAFVFRAKHRFKEIIAYRKTLKTLPFTFDCNVVMAFSPSGIEFARRHLSNPGEARIFCIGNTTGDAAAKAGFSSVYVADEPSVQAVCDLVSGFFPEK